jgi:hypothetical protein
MGEHQRHVIRPLAIVVGIARLDPVRSRERASNVDFSVRFEAQNGLSVRLRMKAVIGGSSLVVFSIDSQLVADS